MGLQQNGEQKETAEKACVVKMSLELTIICVERESGDLTSEPCFLYFPAQLGGEKRRENAMSTVNWVGLLAYPSDMFTHIPLLQQTQHNYYAIACQHGCKAKRLLQSDWTGAVYGHYQPNQPASGYEKTAVASLNLS